MSNLFEGKRCLVTGAAGGIGLGVVRQLLAHGAAAVWMSDAAEEKLAQAAGALEALWPGKIVSAVLDVSDENAFSDLVLRMVQTAGGIDILVNNAGIGCAGYLPKIEEAAIRKTIDVNVLGVIHGCRAAIPYMIRQGGGHIINLGSVASFTPLPWRTIYTTTKFAVLGFTQCLRQELDWMQTGIQLHTVCPSTVDTGIWNGAVPKNAVAPEEVAGEILAGVEQGMQIIPVTDHGRELYDHYTNDPAAFQADLDGLVDLYKPLITTPEIARNLMIRLCRDQ